jgi:hypothetical protein
MRVIQQVIRSGGAANEDDLSDTVIA